MYYYRIKEVIHKTTGKSHFFIEYKKHWWKNWTLFPVFKMLINDFYPFQNCSTYYSFSIVEHIKHYLEKSVVFKGYRIYPVFVYDEKIYGNSEDFEEQNIFTYQVKWTFFKGDAENATANQNKLRAFKTKEDAKKAINEILNPTTKEIIKIYK